jgi:hypothetical protein
MKNLLASLTIALLTQAAHADVVKVDFTTEYNWNDGTTMTVDPIASLTLSLNEDGSIAARFDTGVNQGWNGVAIDSPWNVTASDISQGSAGSWGTSLGVFSTGLACFTGCTGPVSWTISSFDGPFTSVRQLLTGDQSPYDAFFYDGTQYAGMAVETSAVPEPASLALLGLGLAGVGIARRRKGSALRA